MSATLDAELFSSYFGGAGVIHLPVSKKQNILVKRLFGSIQSLWDEYLFILARTFQDK